jgi:hypothetical protein
MKEKSSEKEIKERNIRSMLKCMKSQKDCLEKVYFQGESLFVIDIKKRRGTWKKHEDKNM